MSSSNSVRLAAIEETVYGETPVAGNFFEARFISEGLSGSPETTESAQIRTDRMSSGQVVTGLTLGGSMNFELAKETALENFMSSAMMSDWVTALAVSVDLTIDAAAKTITRAAGDWNSDVRVGDMLTLAGFTDSNNNTQVLVTAINSATVIKYSGSALIANEVGAGTTYQIADYLEIGTTKKSFSIEKQFLDLSNKGINYRGMLASEMALNVNYGELVNGSFSFSGNDYETFSAAVDAITNGRTIDAPATTNTLNGSIDMPVLINSATGALGPASFYIQGVTLNLNNNLTAQNAIGNVAPVDYSAGTANIAVTINSYLADSNWAILGKKLTQEDFALGFILKNGGGAYGFYLPAVQVTFDDPASAGQNQDVTLNMSGTAKVGTGGLSALRIYRA